MAKVSFLFEHGFSFQKIRIGAGHHEVVPYPETLEEAKEFVKNIKNMQQRKTHNKVLQHAHCVRWTVCKSRLCGFRIYLWE
tara:strand:- start:696 stop:938 length:243 start_codon:yes stop_codon:yes gene_type:complete